MDEEKQADFNISTSEQCLNQNDANKSFDSSLMNSWHGGLSNAPTEKRVKAPATNQMIQKAQTLAFFEERKYLVDDFQIG